MYTTLPSLVRLTSRCGGIDRRCCSRTVRDRQAVLPPPRPLTRTPRSPRGLPGQVAGGAPGRQRLPSVAAEPGRVKAAAPLRVGTAMGDRRRAQARHQAQDAAPGEPPLHVDARVTECPPA